jgi:regulator of cell morphogenesis and NO signaling
MSNSLNKLPVETTSQKVLSTSDYTGWDCDSLADYIVQTHHQYVNQAIPQILPLAQKVVEVHGAIHPELVIIQGLFQQLSNELLLHLKKEELVLFPYIKKLSQAGSGGTGVDQSGFGWIKSPISVMETEHETAGIMVKRLAKLSNNYTPPDDACQTFRLFFDKLKAFETDIHQHVHLENDILHPKAIELENALLVG